MLSSDFAFEAQLDSKAAITIWKTGNGVIKMRIQNQQIKQVKYLIFKWIKLAKQLPILSNCLKWKEY